MMGGVRKKESPSPYRHADLRYHQFMQEKESRTTWRREKLNPQFRSIPTAGSSPSVSTITIDTSKAKSNLDLVRLCVQDLGWKEYPCGRRDGGACDVYWNGSTFQETSEDATSGKVNKFPGMSHVLKKIALTKALDHMRLLFPDEYDFYPKTWVIPHQLEQFSIDFSYLAKLRKDQKLSKPTYIVKPDDGSQGEGIYLIKDINDILPLDKPGIVQEYIDSPLLYEDYKFDLRVYVVIYNLEPLNIYICREAMLRFCTLHYEPPKEKNLQKIYMHLTNYSINKYSNTYKHSDSGDGSKRTLSSLFEKLQLQGYDTEKIWESIEEVICKTLLAIIPEAKIYWHVGLPINRAGPSCFQILGFDIILTNDMRALLLEVNSSPSMKIDFEYEVTPGITEYYPSKVDEDIKRPLVRDTLKLVAPPHKLSSRKVFKKSPKENCQISCENLNEDCCCIEEIWPYKYSRRYARLRIVEGISAIFEYFLIMKGSVKWGVSSFMAFGRKCQLINGPFNNASFHILFLTLQKKWTLRKSESSLHASSMIENHPLPSINPMSSIQDTNQRLCFQGFVEAFITLASSKYPEISMDPVEAVFQLLNHCETKLQYLGKRPFSEKVLALPRIDNSQKRNSELREIYDTGNRQNRK